jgi:outer membrane protein assembly factor BamD (BamD/ComL family)
MERIKKYSFSAGRSLLYLIILCLLAACVHKAPSTTPEAVDIAVLQDYYNQGLQFYADEQYGKAKKVWMKVIRLGPDTLVAAKARVYVKKVNRILKTLNEIEKKQ